MGGVWSLWRNLAGCTELTVEPSPLVAEIYARTPLIISQDDRGTYLGGTAADARKLVRPNLMEGFERAALSAKVNSVKNDRPKVLEHADPATLEPAQRSLLAQDKPAPHAGFR